jgi:thiamine monophosphate synthase
MSAGTLGLIEKAAPTLAAAAEISRAVDVPVLCASGLSDMTVPMAIAAGASGVGVGSAVNQLNSELAMIAAVKSLVAATQAVRRHQFV